MKYYSFEDIENLSDYPVTASQLKYWHNKGSKVGSKRIRLKAVRIGANLHTSLGWIDEFLLDLAIEKEAIKKRKHEPSTVVDEMLTD